MRVSKNINRGGEIDDLKEIFSLAKQRQSVVAEHPKGHHRVFPAAFVLSWQLLYALRHRFYYSVNVNDITEVDFEDDQL